MCWIFISTNTTPIYQLDMSWIFIHADRTPNYINADMFWTFISTNTTPNSINLICLEYYQLIELQILSTLIDLGCFFTRIEFGYLSTRIKLGYLFLYFYEYDSKFYQLNMSWILSTPIRL